MLLPAEKVFELMNEYGNTLQPFLFGIDFEGKQGFFMNPSKAAESGIYFNINGNGNNFPPVPETATVRLVKNPVEFIQEAQGATEDQLPQRVQLGAH